MAQSMEIETIPSDPELPRTQTINNMDPTCISRAKRRFNEIFNADQAYQELVTADSVPLPSSFSIFMTMSTIYLFSIWNSLTDIFVLISISKACKASPFIESGQSAAFWTIITASYLSAIIGFLYVVRGYKAAISCYSKSTKSQNKSFWDDGLKYVAIQRRINLHLNSHCNKEKFWKTLFTLFEDYLQFALTTTLLVFYQDGDILVFLSWITSLICIFDQMSCDIFLIMRGTVVKCCCARYQCKAKCYEEDSQFVKISYYSILILFSSGMISLIIVVFALGFAYSGRNGFIGGTIYYQFSGDIHWRDAEMGDISHFDNVTGSGHSNPFNGEVWIEIYGNYSFRQIGISFIEFKRNKGQYVEVVFRANNEGDSVYWITDDASCNITQHGASCYVSSEKNKDYLLETSLDSEAIDASSSVWTLKYEIDNYQTC